MKRFTVMALALMMVASVCAGCRRADKKDEPMATTTAPTTPMATTTAPTMPMMTTPTDPMMPNDSIGHDDMGADSDPNGSGDTGTDNAQPGTGDAGSSTPSQRNRMRRIG